MEFLGLRDLRLCAAMSLRERLLCLDRDILGGGFGLLAGSSSA